MHWIIQILIQCTGSFKSCYTPPGTNFGYMNGAMSKDGYKYNVRVTSYDYDSPLTEAGIMELKHSVISIVAKNVKK